MFGITTSFLLLGSMGYLAFGASTSTFITLNLEAGPLAVAVRGMFAGAILLCYPLNIFPAIQSLEHLLDIDESEQAQARGGWSYWRRDGDIFRNTARSLLVGSAYGFAIVARDSYDNLTGLTGGLCAVPLAFIFPGMCHYKVFRGQSAAAAAIDIGLVTFGAVMAPLAVVTALITWK